MWITSSVMVVGAEALPECYTVKPLAQCIEERAMVLALTQEDDANAGKHGKNKNLVRVDAMCALVILFACAMAGTLPSGALPPPQQGQRRRYGGGGR